jgi:hypothetical protein
MAVLLCEVSVDLSIVGRLVGRIGKVPYLSAPLAREKWVGRPMQSQAPRS